MVRYSPEPGRIETQKFVRKGLAFAYARRKAPDDSQDTVEVERQVVQPDGEVRDDRGRRYKPVDLWTFHKSGDVDHARL